MSKPRIATPQVEIEEFCQRHGIRRMALFGSVLTEGFSPDSDVDVLVEFEPDRRLGLAFFGIQDELAELLGVPVDLNTAAFLSRYFRDDVMRSAFAIYDAEAPRAA